MDSTITVEIDEAALKDAANRDEVVLATLEQMTSEICSRANAYGASFETERTVVWATKEHVGGTQPEYGYNVRKGDMPIGLVMPKNYAAMKDNHLHNTLLKASR